MQTVRNPFEYDAATSLTPEEILDYYIEDFSFSRFLQSARNIFLVGERGCGKTMALLYNSYKVQAQKNPENPRLDRIAVYVPCNNPLTQRRDFELLPEHQAAAISEHFLVLAILFALADTAAAIPQLLTKNEEKSIRAHYRFLINARLPTARSFFHSMLLFVQRELAQTQETLNAGLCTDFYPKALTFASSVMGLFDLLRRTKRLERTHFIIMIDDAHYLNTYQNRLINSWIAYRDHSQFSLKIASAKVDQPEFITTTQGSILEGHDFALVDMEQPYQFDTSNFGRMARQIVEKRLARIGPRLSVERFFPMSPELEVDLAECEKIVRKRAFVLMPKGSKKQIQDYVYKYARAEYFRRRSTKANRPIYSGFETITYLSTGIVRNLLEPCFWMYDKAVSLQREKDPAEPVNHISPAIQREIILDRSERLWEMTREKLPKIVVGCSSEQGKRVYQLLDNLAVLFRERLLRHRSEPRANSFTISSADADLLKELNPLLRIAMKAQLLYTRSGPAKDEGRREVYYVPNRMLWPSRGLDPQGQHARVSLKAQDLYAAAWFNKKLPFLQADDDDQGELFQ